MTEHSEDENLIERGVPERRIIKQQCLKNNKANINSFFQKFRGYCENSTSNRRDEVNMLIKELEKTLTLSEKESLIKKWKPASTPVVVLSSMEQLHEIRDFFNGLDLNHLTVQRRSTNVEVQSLQTFAGDKSQYQQGLSSHSNGIQSYIPSHGMNGHAPVMRDQARCVASQFHTNYRSDVEENSSPELFNVTLEVDQSDRLSDTIENILGNGTEEDLLEDIISLTLINQLFNELSDIIQIKGDLMAALSRIRNVHDRYIYEDVLKFCDKDKEPIVFQISTDLSRYTPVLDVIHSEGLFNLNQRNAFNISIFYFLIMNSIDTLYLFLKYTKSKDLQSEVYNICSKDGYFKAALTTKKSEIANQSVQWRNRLESVEKFCMT